MEASPLRASLVAALALAAAGVAHAADDTWALDRANFYVGSYTNDLSLHGRINGSIDAQGTILEGTDIDFKKTFDFGGSHNLLQLGASWRPFDRHQLSFDYHRDSREGFRRLQRDIVFEGETFPVDASVDARFLANVYDVRYTYFPLLTQTDALGFSLGLVDYRVSLRLKAQGSFSNESSVQTLAGTADSHVPSPLVGLSYHHAFSEHWRAFVDAAYFKATFHEVDGHVVDGHVGVEYFPWEHVGFAALYEGYRLDADVSRHQLDGHLDLRSSGFQLQLRAR